MNTPKFNLGDKVKTLSPDPLRGVVEEISLKNDVIYYRINIIEYGVFIEKSEYDLEPDNI